jgi:hypothetical protein
LREFLLLVQLLVQFGAWKEGHSFRHDPLYVQLPSETKPVAFLGAYPTTSEATMHAHLAK